MARGFFWFIWWPAPNNLAIHLMVDEFPTSSTSDLDQYSIEIYPNPASEIIHLDQRVELIQFYDAKGRLVLSKENSDYLAT